MVHTPKHTLPTWIPAGLIEAVRDPQQKNVDAVLGLASLEEIKKIPQRAPSNSITSLLLFLGYHNTKGVYRDFIGKKVLDIGGGFGGVAPNLYASAETIIVVDPIFQEAHLEQLLQKNIQSQKEIVWLRKAYCEKHTGVQKLHSDICEAKLVGEECEWWQSYTPEKFPHIKRNPSYGERLLGIEDESQDVIFATYVLSKETVQIDKVVSEIDRVLSPNGIAIISDYHDEKGILNAFKKYFHVEVKYFDIDGIILKCHKK